MVGPKKLIPALVIAGFLFLVSGCGHEAVFRGEEPPPLSGDVVVVGDSIAGLVAALEAVRQGAAVMVFYDQPGEERWLWNEGAIFAEVEETEAVTELLSALSLFGGGRGKSWHYERLALSSGPDLAWLARETGVVWAGESELRYRPDNLSVDQAYTRLVEAAMREGVRFLKGAVVRDLITADDGYVAGIIFESSPGILRSAYARAVILAGGGYLGDRELLEEYAPSVTAASWRLDQTGTALRLGRGAGLDLVEEDLFSFSPAVEENHQWVKADWPPGTLLIAANQVIPLAHKSEQEVIEDLLNSPDRSGYLLVAEAYLGQEHNLNWPRFAGIDAFMEAYRLDIPVLKRWFVQPWGYFLGRPVTAVAEYCLGGIAVNENGEALKNNEPVRGLYAVGEAAGGLHGRSLMPGAALSEAVVWGRHVGRTAAVQAQQ